MKILILIMLFFILLCSCTEGDTVTRFEIEVIDENIPPLDSNLILVVTSFENSSILGPRGAIAKDTISREGNGNFVFDLSYQDADEHEILFWETTNPLNPNPIFWENMACRPTICPTTYFSGRKYKFEATFFELDP